LILEDFVLFMDRNYNDAYYAKVYVLSTTYINHLEIEFLVMLEFSLQLIVSVLESYSTHPEQKVSLGGGYEIGRAI
jgi:hypothetical protein